MIRLPKLFKRNPQADDLNRVSAGSRRTARKLPIRQSRRPSENEDLPLTEDPEQQRARHRLIGAATLVLIAVIGLPRILDSKPKAVNNDIAVNIVTSLPAPNAIQPAQDMKQPELAKNTATPVNPEPSPTPPPSVDSKAESKPTVVNTPTTNTKGAALGLAAGEEVVATSAAPKADPKPESKPTSPAAKTISGNSGKFVIQIGAFASEDRAKGWTAKMKEQKIPNYTLNKTGADGVKLHLLRAGPFSSKEAADAAEKKLKAMGLSPRVVEVGSN